MKTVILGLSTVFLCTSCVMSYQENTGHRERYSNNKALYKNPVLTDALERMDKEERKILKVVIKNAEKYDTYQEYRGYLVEELAKYKDHKTVHSYLETYLSTLDFINKNRNLYESKTQRTWWSQP